MGSLSMPCEQHPLKVKQAIPEIHQLIPDSSIVEIDGSIALAKKCCGCNDHYGQASARSRSVNRSKGTDPFKVR